MGGITAKSATPQNEPDRRRLNLQSAQAVLTAREACDYLRISKWTLYRLIGAGQIKTMKISNRRLIRRQSLEAYMEEKEAELG
jgi:excisionase family DNA binding protein